MAPSRVVPYDASIPDSPGVAVPFRRLAVFVALAAVVLVACGDDGGEVTLVEGEETEVLAIDNVFQPEDVTVPAGTVVLWSNNGRNDHNIIPEDEGAEWRVESEDFVPGDEAEFRFTEPGSYRYFCSIHGTIDVGMIGTIIIE
jgi:plastocyanin